MQKNDNDFFDLTKIYDLDEGSLKSEETKNMDNLNEILGYDFLDEEIDPNLDVMMEIDTNTENEENRSLAEFSNEIEIQNRINKTSENEELNTLKEKIFNFEGVNLKNIRDFLETQTGKIATIEMTIANDRLVDKIGTILAVGKDFLLLKETQTGNILVCPLKNIEFIRLNY